MLKAIVKRLGSLNVMLAYVGGYVLFGMMILTVCDVTGRYIFNLPITGAYEISEAMMVTVVFFFIGYAQAKKAHVAVDLIVNVLPGKLKIVIEIITQLLSFLMILLIAGMSLVRWHELLKINEHTPILGIPVSPFFLILATGCSVFCVELGKRILRLVKDG
jgi:TRAP-type transport system small permease protein